jgi:protein ImuB
MRSLSATVMALLAAGSWNGNVMSAFSENRRRILSLWLPRLPIDRIKRQSKAFSSEVDTGSRKENASKQNYDTEPSIVVAKQHNALLIFSLDDAAARFGLDVSRTGI